MLTFINELSESKLFPAFKSIEKQDAVKLSELLHLHLCALRILLSEHITRDWAVNYCKKTAQSNFKKWNSSDNDIAVMLFALTSNTDIKKAEFRDSLPIDLSLISLWIKAASRDNEQELITKRIFTRLDTMLKIKDDSLKAIRRLVLDWPELDLEERKLSVTRMLQYMRHRSPRSDVLLELEKLSSYRSLELHDVCNLETGKNCDKKETETHPIKKSNKFGMISALAGGIAGYALGRRNTLENATAGATSAANVAITPTVLGGIGVGFNPKGDKGVYGKSKGLLLRRPSLLEGVEKITIKSYGGNEKEVKIFINPSNSVLKKMTEIRGLIMDNNLYIWNAIDATHHEVVNSYGMEETQRFEISNNNGFIVHYHKADFDNLQSAEEFFYASPNLLKALIDFQIKDDLFI